MATENGPADAFNRLLIWQSVLDAQNNQRLLGPEEFQQLLESTEWGTGLSLGLITGRSLYGESNVTNVMYLDPSGARMGYWCGGDDELGRFIGPDVVLFRSIGNRIKEAVSVNLDPALRRKVVFEFLDAADQAQLG